MEPLLQELYEGICGSHTGGRSLAYKALAQGYWWPSMQRTSQEYAKKCDQCQRYCGKLGIRNRYSMPAYSQGNGQAEATNKVIVSGLKKRLDDVKGKWVDELPRVLWSYRTTPRRLTRETSFSMTYRAEAVISLELGFSALRTDQFNTEENNCLLLDSLDVAEERREVATVKMTYYQ
ncbi:uncharacterized protein LOC142640190 [Castanea sativa]|uniref:uncharacterized protein LOC142640190 n=1 Tax=Castanea sativa TaxID=21020 RepID=UPI003F653DF9